MQSCRLIPALLLPPADPAGAKPRRDHRFLDRVSRHVVPKTPGYLRRLLNIRPRQGSHSLSQIVSATPYRGRDTSPTHPFPGVFGAMPLDTRAKQRAPLPGCHPPTVLSFGRIGWRDRHPVCILRPSLPADPAGAKPRRDHRFLDRVSRHEVPKTPGYLRRLLNIRPRQGSHSLSQIDSATPYRGRDTSSTHSFPGVFGAMPLDTRAKQRVPLSGCHPPMILSINSAVRGLFSVQYFGRGVVR